MLRLQARVGDLRSVDSSAQSGFRLFRPPAAASIPLEVAPRLWSWNRAGHPDQTRLTTFLDHVESRLREANAPSQPLALQLNVALAPRVDLLAAHDLDNYLIPIVLRLGGDRVVSAWATKSRGGSSTIQIEAAREAALESLAGWKVAHASACGSASSRGWKRQIQDQVAGQCERAPDGPLEMQISYRVGLGRRWNNIWKQSIDALGPILGLVRQSNPFHPLDGRITRLGLHHTPAAGMGFDVGLGIWWREAEGTSACNLMYRLASRFPAVAAFALIRAKYLVPGMKVRVTCRVGALLPHDSRNPRALGNRDEPHVWNYLGESEDASERGSSQSS